MAFNGHKTVFFFYIKIIYLITKLVTQRYINQTEPKVIDKVSKASGSPPNM